MFCISIWNDSLDHMDKYVVMKGEGLLSCEIKLETPLAGWSIALQSSKRTE